MLHLEEIEPSSFIFDPEIDDPHRDLLFEFIIAGTWEKALGIIDDNREVTEQEAFWATAKSLIEACGDNSFRDVLIRQCRVAWAHLADELSDEERVDLNRLPKPRLQGDLAKAQQIASLRESAIAAGDVELDKSIVRRVLTIDPCATTMWLAPARRAQDSGNEALFDRCMKRFALCLMAEFDIGMFAFRHGVQAVARNRLETCLRILSGSEVSYPTIVVSALNTLAIIHGDLDECEESVRHLRRACEIAEKSASTAALSEGIEQPYGPADILRLKISLAHATLRSGRLDEAEAQLTEALSTVLEPTTNWEDRGRLRQLAHARVLIGLGDIARRRGEEDRAITFMIRGIENLGLRVGTDGRLSNADGELWTVSPSVPIADVSAESFPDPKPDSFDPTNTWFADPYEHLVSLLTAATDVERDCPARLDADMLRLAMSPRYSTQRGKALSRLGTTLWRLGMHERAEAAHRAALAEYSETERGWSAIADSEQILAEILLFRERPADAMPLVDAAIAHFPEVHDLGADEVSANLAQCHFLRARIRARLTSSPTEAERRLVIEDLRGAASHLNTVSTGLTVTVMLDNVASYLIALGEYEEAAILLIRSVTLTVIEHPRYIDVSTSSSSALDRIGQPHSLFLILTLLSAGSISKERFLPQLFAILFGVRDLSVAALRKATERRTGAGENSRTLLEQLQAVRQRIHVARLAEHQAATIEALLRTEREIKAQLHDLTGARLEDASAVELLQGDLRNDEAYVEFLSFQPIQAELNSDIRFSCGEARVVAIFCAVRTGDSSSIELFDLGEERELSALVDFLNRPYLFGDRHKSELDVHIAHGIGWKVPGGTDDNVVGHLREIYRGKFDAILDALIRKMSDYGRWNVGVRGVLSKLAFDFLPVCADYASNRVEIVRDPVSANHRGARAASPSAPKGAPVVMGAPAFENSPSTSEGNRELRSWSLAPLLGARVETEAIANLFGISAVVGPAATREFLLKLENPSILHIATHGFYIRPNQREQAAEAVRRSLNSQGQVANDALARLTRDDPYCHIGLALAGANRWLDETSQSGLSSGLVFGDEIATMNLLHTDLVVLSCCDSGLGQVHFLHGVINLPRAFLCTGAKAVIASLWPLADELVMPVMLDFYRYLLDGETVSSSLTRAKRDAIRRGDPKLVWGALQLYGTGDHAVNIPNGRFRPDV